MAPERIPLYHLPAGDKGIAGAAQRRPAGAGRLLHILELSRKKGYSGVATFAKDKPLGVHNGFGVEKFDSEGRVVITEFTEFTLFNIYFPNGKKDDIRLQYKLDFYDYFLDYADQLKSRGKKLLVCGDFNTAHNAIDLARPRENEKVSGFLPVERKWMDKFVDHGFIDTFRQFRKEPGNYTWWDMKTRARERNVGWRLDYFFATENIMPTISEAFIMPEIIGSDHCPVGIIINLD
jgi:exodeoxyribonuclease-3